MEAVADFAELCGTQNETVVKELSIGGHNFLETFQFQSPYGMRPHGNSENSLNLDYGHIPYTQLASVLSEDAVGVAHLYAYRDSKCTFIAQLLGRPVCNLEDFNCPSPLYFRPKFSCTKHNTEIPRSVALLDRHISSMSG
jgi:hypothetical protein